MTENDRLTEKRDGQNVIPLRQDGKTKWSLASAGMGDASTQFLYGTHADKLADYEAIGTVEGYEKAIQSSMEYYNLMKEYKTKVDEFEAIGTIEEFKALKEKSTPNELAEHNFQDEVHHYLCPSCRNIVSCTQNYCEECGQALEV